MWYHHPNIFSTFIRRMIDRGKVKNNIFQRGQSCESGETFWYSPCGCWNSLEAIELNAVVPCDTVSEL